MDNRRGLGITLGIESKLDITYLYDVCDIDTANKLVALANNIHPKYLLDRYPEMCQKIDYSKKFNDLVDKYNSITEATERFILTYAFKFSDYTSGASSRMFIDYYTDEEIYGR